MDEESAEIVPADAGNFSEDFAADIERYVKCHNFTLVFLDEKLSPTKLISFVSIPLSGWNSENSPQQQSPSNNQQIPPLGNLPQQQQQFGAAGGNFRGNNRFSNAGRGGRGRGGNNNSTWNPHMQGQPSGPIGIPPPNLNQPPPKMVSKKSRREQWKIVIS